MKLSTVNNTFKHQITGGGEYGWACYGPNARSIDYTSDYAHGYVVFDTENHTVYSIEVSPNMNRVNDNEPKPYRWLNPDHIDVYYSEAAQRNIDPDQAWDAVKWSDCELAEDFIEKATAMFNGAPFDTRISIPINLDSDTMLQLAMEAHKRDITMNKMVEVILQQVINEHECNRN